ncbi:MAG: YybH family protein [Caldilineaceae bacterium]|jgi:ketosteroid isomerase-like protein
MHVQLPTVRILVLGVSLLLGVVLLAACVPVAPAPSVSAQAIVDEPDMDMIAAEVQDFWDEYARTNVAGDIESWIALWDEAGVKMIPDHPPIVGRDSVLAFKQAASQKVDVTSMTISNQDVELSGDLATVRGVYEGVKTPKDGSAPIIIDGWYASVLKRQSDGSWGLLWDTCASNVPPAAASEPDMDEVAAEVQAFWDEYARTNIAGDLEGWIALWDEAGVKMIPDFPPIVGRDNVLAFKQAASEKVDVTSMSITNQDVALSGDWAMVRGIYDAVKTPKDGSAPNVIDGWYESVLKRQPDGSWGLYWDTCASKVPPASP